MQDKLTRVSYGLAALASICFVCGLVVMVNEGGDKVGQS